MTEPGARAPRPSLLLPPLLAVPALLSFLLLRFLRVVLHAAKRRYSAKHPESSHQWQVFSQDFIDKPLVVPLIMTSAPRWNPHAVIGTLGPLTVRKTIAFEAGATRASGDWFFAIHRLSDRRAAGTISHRHDPGGDWIELRVPEPGTYMVGARFYHAPGAVTFPATQVDGIDVAGPRGPVTDANHFYTALWERENGLYRAMAFYIWALLRCRGRVPERWIAGELLPVGNPETQFAYGVCRAGTVLAWRLGPGDREAFDLYLTIYSRGSFPRAWAGIDASATLTSPCDGFYLARIQPKGADFGSRPPGQGFPAIEIA